MTLLDAVTIQQIRCFLAVAKTLRFSDAAESLNLSQSAITKKIVNLERQLNVQLFDRTTRRVSLTPAGEQLRATANQLNNVAISIENQMTVFQQTQTDYLRVGMIAFSSHQPVFDRIATFATEHPHITLETIQRTTQPLVEQVLTGELDAAFVSSMYTDDESATTFADDQRFLAKSVAKDSYYLVCAQHNAFSGLHQVSYSDLGEAKFIFPESGMDVYHKALLKTFADHNITPHVLMRCGTIAEVLSLVKQNLGVAILSAQVIDDSNDLSLIPFAKPLVRNTQLIVRASRHTRRVVSAFYQYF
ncbi:LysR family transcriptional regulator [Lacticaseibacillus baoqingensis]|uniref:LysR family transcriptional regulator n=1 Tax=Lacticaseibacillus baoqingensis TaxID=2486013 RepID=A0ABW4EBE0_9LACO|nr:LysR family transcriptional regulator [Lacticaseibacillus baoqingensis]